MTTATVRLRTADPADREAAIDLIQALNAFENGLTGDRLESRAAADASNEFPAGTRVLPAEEPLGLRPVRDPHVLTVPFDPAAGAVGDVAEVVRLGQRGRVVERAACRRAVAAGMHSFAPAY